MTITFWPMMIFLVVVMGFLSIAMGKSRDGKLDKLTTVGATWRIHLRWSGYAIASESRRDGGFVDWWISEVHQDGTVTLTNGTTENTGKPIDVWNNILCSRSETSGGRNVQYRNYSSEYIGVTEKHESSRGVYDDGLSAALSQAGVAGASAYIGANI